MFIITSVLVHGKALSQFTSNIRHKKEGQFSNCFKFLVWRNMKAIIYPNVSKTYSLVTKEKEIHVGIFTKNLLWNFSIRLLALIYTVDLAVT